MKYNEWLWKAAVVWLGAFAIQYMAMDALPGKIFRAREREVEACARHVLFAQVAPADQDIDAIARAEAACWLRSAR